MRIRAVTLFLGREARGHGDLISAFGEEVDRVARDMKLEVWTKRLALAPFPAGELPNVAGLVEDLAKSMLVAVPAEMRDRTDAETIVKALDGNDDLFTSICGGLDELMLFAALLRKASSELGPDACTRISFTLGEIKTPYFPSASAPRGEVGIAASMLYADDVRSALRSGANAGEVMRRSYARADELLRKVSHALNVENYGVDLSLSPWMEESVARLVEEMGGGEFGGPGSHYAVYELNAAISSVASSQEVRAVGFNEVMLPYAEDSRLLELGAQGKLTAYSLLSFAQVCVAGLDMVVIPYHGEEELERFLKDVYAVLSNKGRPSGIRVVLAQGEAGDVLELKRFGKVTVIRLR